MRYVFKYFVSLKIEGAFYELGQICWVIKGCGKNHLYHKSLLKSYAEFFQF